jgi:hypothetical protein
MPTGPYYEHFKSARLTELFLEINSIFCSFPRLRMSSNLFLAINFLSTFVKLPSQTCYVPTANLRRWCHQKIIFFLSFDLLIGGQLSICNCCKPFFAQLYNCQLLCFWRLALSIVVEVFPQPFFRILLLQGCFLQTRYAQLYALSMSGVYFLRFLKVIIRTIEATHG